MGELGVQDKKLGPPCHSPPCQTLSEGPVTPTSVTTGWEGVRASLPVCPVFRGHPQHLPGERGAQPHPGPPGSPAWRWHGHSQP